MFVVIGLALGCDGTSESPSSTDAPSDAPVAAPEAAPDPASVENEREAAPQKTDPFAEELTAPPISKTSLRGAAGGKTWVFDLEGGPRKVDSAQAEARGYTLISLSDDWVPYIFTQSTPGLEDEQPNTYAARYLDLANDRTDADGDPLPEGSRNDLEHYGIPPTLGVLVAEWSRARDQVQPCLQKAKYDPQVFKDFPGEFLSYKRKQGQTRLNRLRSAKSVLDKAMRAAKIPAGDYAAAAEHPETERAHERWATLAAEVAVIEQAQIRLRCERLFETHEGRGKFKPGDFDGPTTHALAAFEKRNAIMGWGHFNRDNLDMLALDAVETIHARLVRVLRQRVSSGAGLLEDGSARDWKPDFRWKDASGQEHALRDLTQEALDATLATLGLDDPATAYDRLSQLQELGGGSFDSLVVAIKLPPRPAYYSADMDFEAVIDRGDVWYDFPYDDEGNKLGQPRKHYPHLTLYVNYEGQRIPLVHWRTTIGSWRSEIHDGKEWFAYKNSDVGPRVWKDIMAAPAWIPPDYTPTRTLTKKKWIDGRWKRVVNYDETGPGYQSAYGLVAAYHIKQVKRDDGTVRAELDNQIRTHGSVDYMSIMRRYSHGCHRLYNMNAVRMFSFILQHRNYSRDGQHQIGYGRAFEYEGEEYRMAIDTRGYRYRLEVPIPVMVTPGNVRGDRKSPYEELMPKPGVDYAPEIPQGELPPTVDPSLAPEEAPPPLPSSDG